MNEIETDIMTIIIENEMMEQNDTYYIGKKEEEGRWRRRFIVPCPW